MSSAEETNPMLEVFAVVIVVAAVTRKIYIKGLQWLDAVQAFFVSIWPVIYATLITLAVLVLLFTLGKFLLQKWKAHQKYIDDLCRTIGKHEKTIQSKNVQIERLQRTITEREEKAAQLKDGLSRYHRLLVRKIESSEPNPRQTQAKVKSALASVLQDFGGSPASRSKGGWT